MCHMNKLYNTQDDFATKISNFLHFVYPNIRKSILNFLPYVLIAIINAESLVASDIANKLKGKFKLIKKSSNVKRIRRLFKNPLFNSHFIYDKIIRFVISTYKKKHSDKRIHIVFDHMFSKSHYTIFMISMRIGKQGIPLWWKSFKGYAPSDAFDSKVLKEGISYVSNLFPKDFDLIFLADRWFSITTLMQHIHSLKHTYVIRFKGNIKMLIYDKKEKHKIWKHLKDLSSYKYHSYFYNDIIISNNHMKVNIAISKNKDVKEPWILITNGDAKRAIKDYGYRFGAIECIFKNQKSNGFWYYKSVIINYRNVVEYYTSFYYD